MRSCQGKNAGLRLSAPVTKPPPSCALLSKERSSDRAHLPHELEDSSPTGVSGLPSSAPAAKPYPFCTRKVRDTSPTSTLTLQGLDSFLELEHSCYTSRTPGLRREDPLGRCHRRIWHPTMDPTILSLHPFHSVQTREKSLESHPRENVYLLRLFQFSSPATKRRTENCRPLQTVRKSYSSLC